MSELVIPDRGRQPVPRGWAESVVLPQLAELQDIGRVDDGRAKLRGEVNAWKAKGYETSELQAAERYCELRIGELLGPGKTEKGGRGQKAYGATEGFDHHQRHEFRQLAWPQKHRKLTLEAIRDGRLSRGRILRYIEEQTRDIIPNGDRPTLDLRRGDFREVLADVEDDSVALILTDPPYPAEYLPLWSALSEFAARVLVPGGSLLAYSGQGNLPEALSRLSERLRYWWMLSLKHEHGSQNLPGKFVTIGWKPILWFVKDRRRDKRYLADQLSGSVPRKQSGPVPEWSQGRAELFPLIESLTAPGELIVDPFAGSGTTGEAVLDLKRAFIGAEIDG